MDCGIWEFVKSAGANALGGLVGVFVGAFFALSSDRVIAARRKMEEKRELVSGIEAALGRNLVVLQRLEDGSQGAIKKGSLSSWIPTFSADVVLLKSSSMRKYELGFTIECCKAVDQTLSELNELNAKLEVLRANYVQFAVSSSAFCERYKAIAYACISHLKGEQGYTSIAGQINTTLALLAKEDLKLPTIFDHDPIGELFGRSD